MIVADIPRIIRYAVSVCNAHRDDCAEVNLTALDKDVINHFGMTDEEYEDLDLSFYIFQALERRNLL